MFLGIIIFIVLLADIWLSWGLGSWLGVGVFLAFIPLSIFFTLGGGLALGIVGMIFGKHDDRTRLRRFMTNFLRGWAWLVCLLWLMPWLLLGALQFTNNTAPATIPKITISNGEKTVVFQSMIHIGSPGFYDDIQADMENLRGREYVFFYEGVEAGSPESMEKISRLMGMNVSEKMYSISAKMSGLIIQDATRYLGIIPSTNIDISTDEIIALAEDENIEAPLEQEKNILSYLEEKYPDFTPFQKHIALIVSRGVLNILLRTYTNPELEQALKKELPIFEVILDKRNEILAQSIIDSPVPNIYIHYGALHYSGVLKILKEKDPRWTEIAKTNLQVIR